MMTALGFIFRADMSGTAGRLSLQRVTVAQLSGNGGLV